MGDREGQELHEGLEEVHLLDGFLARGHRGAECASGSCRKLSQAEAIQKARKLKAVALGLRYSE